MSKKKDLLSEIREQAEKAKAVTKKQLLLLLFYFLQLKQELIEMKREEEEALLSTDVKMQELEESLK